MQEEQSSTVYRMVKRAARGEGVGSVGTAMDDGLYALWPMDTSPAAGHDCSETRCSLLMHGPGRPLLDARCSTLSKYHRTRWMASWRIWRSASSLAIPCGLLSFPNVEILANLYVIAKSILLFNVICIKFLYVDTTIIFNILCL